MKRYKHDFYLQKITLQNAFSLKLVDCLEQVIASPDFDITNMQVIAETRLLIIKVHGFLNALDSMANMAFWFELILVLFCSLLVVP